MATLATAEMSNCHFRKNIWPIFLDLKAISLICCANLEEKACNKMHLIAAGLKQSMKYQQHLQLGDNIRKISQTLRTLVDQITELKGSF